MNIGNVNRQAQPATSDAAVQARQDAPDQSSAAAARAASAAGGSAGTTNQTQRSTAAQRSASEAHALEQQNEASRESVERLVDRISRQLQVERRSLSFTVDDQLGKTIVKVIDLETDEVITQIPSEELLRVAEAIDAISQQQASGASAPTGTGLLIQEKA